MDFLPEDLSFPVLPLTSLYSRPHEKVHETIQLEWNAEYSFGAENINGLFRSKQSTSFQFRGNRWDLLLWPESEFCPGFLGLQLMGSFNPEMIEYNFGLKRFNGSAQLLAKGIVEPARTISSRHNVIKLSDLEKKEEHSLSSNDDDDIAELANSTTFTIICTMSCGTAHSLEEPSSAEQFNKLEKLDTLSENFKSLFMDEDSCDTTLRVVCKDYRAHRLVLMARSTVFAAMFKHDSSEKQTGIVTIPDCDPDSFHDFLLFLYSGKVQDLSYTKACHLYNTSDKYNVQGLKDICIDYLVQCLTVENICDIVVFADNYGERKLFSEAQNFFNKNLNEILKTPEWESLIVGNFHLANKLLKDMSSKMKVMESKPEKQRMKRKNPERHNPYARFVSPLSFMDLPVFNNETEHLFDRNVFGNNL